MQNFNNPFLNSFQMQVQVQPVFVGSIEEARSIQTVPNTIHVALNRGAKEVYTKRLNNDGIIEFEVYKVSSGEDSRQNELDSIVKRLEALENRNRRSEQK